MTGAWVALLVLFVAFDACGVWAAGYLLAMEDVVGGTRNRFENWAYRSPDQVRSEDPRDQLDMDYFWDRVQLWPLFRKRAITVYDDTVPQPPMPSITIAKPGLPASAHRWTYRGGVTFADLGVKGRKVPHRVRTQLHYGVPLLDGQPLGKLDIVVTVLRGKAADLWGCPKCSGMWGGAVFAVVASHWGPWGYSVVLVAVLHVAAWGAARRVGWSE